MHGSHSVPTCRSLRASFRWRLLAGPAILAASWPLVGCASPGHELPGDSPSPWLAALLDSEPARFADLLARADELRLKIELAVVVPREGKPATLERHSFSAGPEYFYPASTVKTCAAIAAAQTLRRIDAQDEGIALDLDTPLRFHPLFPGEVIEELDPSHVDGGRITLGHDMRKVFLVSDNAAYNRLYEFAGNAFVNESMRAAGLESTRIFHRLSEFRSPEDQLRTPRIELLEGNRTLATVPERTSGFDETNGDLTGTSIGVGVYAGGEVTAGPMSFLLKNYIALRDLQDLHIMLLRPDVAIPGRGDDGAAEWGFELDPRDRAFMAAAMAETPGQSSDPVYPAAEYPDDYSKFLGPGVWRVLPRSAAVIRDKVGRAYGFSTTNSEVTDERTGRSYFLAATIYINPNGVLNDGVYGYERADQFFADLGEVVTRAVLGPAE